MSHTLPLGRLALVFVALLFVGCGSGNGVRETRDPNVVTAADTDGQALARVEDMLRGQVAGVQVRQEGGNLVIRIRGTESIRADGNADPLVFIDGIAVPLGVGGALQGINPRDVASIRVLKNASETAMYGSRGANGVIVITTVRPDMGDPDGSGPGS